MIQSYKLSKLRKKTNIYPWWIYLFLFTVFFVAQPFDLLYSVHLADEEITSDMIFEAGIERNLSGNLTRRFALFSLGAFALVSLLRKTRNRIQINGHLGWLIIFFLAWAFISLTWAGDGLFLAARRVVILGMLSLGALAIAKRFSLENLIVFAFISGVITLVLGFCCEAILGTFQPFGYKYRFSGLMHPIYQAINCGMMSLSALVLARTTERGRIFYLVAAFSGVFFILLTKSRGPTAFFIIAVVAYWSMVLSIYRKFTYTYIFLTAIILLFFAFGNNYEGISKKLLLLGRQEKTIESTTTLTGRIPLWKECLDYAAQRPFLGYGYDSFWTPYRSNKMFFVTGWAKNDTHNAFIDVLLGLGIPGVFAFTLIVLISIKRSFSFYKASNNNVWAFVYAILIMYLLNNLLLAQHLHPHIPTFIILTIFAKLGFCNFSTSEEL